MTLRDGGMGCRGVRELLSLYAEGELDGARGARVAAHLAECPACRERMELDCELAARLAALTPAEGLAARRTALRGKVMAQVEKERRWQPWRRAALQLGNAATWAAVAAIAAVLVLAISISARPLAERAWRGQAPAGTPAPAGIGWQVVKDEVIAAPYYWVVDGERVDRTPQISPDGSKIAYLPTVDGQATDIDRLVVRDLETGQDRDLTPEEGYSYTSVRWSPDSKTLAFVKYRYDEGQAAPSELWRVDADGGNLTRLYAAQQDGGSGARGPLFSVQRWSADGQHILLDPTIWGGGDGAYRVRASDGRPEELALPTALDLGVRDDASPGSAIFSPTDDYVLCVAKTGDLLSPPTDAPEGGQSLVLYDLAARQARVLASFPHEISGISPSDISPDGEWISFVTVALVEGEGAWQPGTLWVVRRDGTGLREVTLNGEPAPGDMPGPLWAGNGRAYYNQPPYVSAIWICELDAASGDADLITHKFPARDLVSVSRDGRRLLIVRGGGENAQLCLLTLAPKPASAPTVEPDEQDTAGLTVEEHDVTTVGTGFANNEGTEWIGPEILDVRRAWREPAPAEQVVATNEALRPFGLRLEPKEKPGWSQPFYDLYKGDRLVLGDLDTVWPASVSAAGDDFALLVEQLNGGYYLVRATGSEKWDGSQQQGQPPVFVGRDLVSVTGVFELCNVTVLRGSVPVYTSSFEGCGATYPVKGLWSWQGHWVLEASGRLIQDGVDLNDQLGYDEIFGYRLIRGQPFYFFKQGGRVGVSYDGVTLPQQYDEVRHYGCCSAAAYNPGGNDTMTWFFGLRDGTWYYVEMGRYAAEEASAPATPTPERSEPIEIHVATPQAAQGAGAIKALHMVNSQIGWAEAERGILRTTDGGASWEEAMPWWREGKSSEPESSQFIAGTFFLDAQRAWVAWGPAAGTRLTVEYTADGGRNWQSSLLPVEGMSAQFSFVDARRGWVLVHQGVAAGSEGVAVLGTLDGGATWKVLSASDPQNPQPGQVPFAGNKRGIAFADAANGWLTLFEPVDGKVFLYATHDGGHTWAEQALTLPDGYEETQPAPEAPVFFSAQEGVLAVNAWREGPSRLFYITHDGGATWSAAAPVDAAVNGSVVSDFISVDEAWALVQPVPGGSGGVELRHTTDGGQTWTALTTDPALAGMLALDFVDGRTGWALCLGEEGTYVLKTTDAGSTWARMP